jgi:hypothetical protein
MKKIPIFLACLTFLLITAIAFGQGWKKLKGQHFIIYFLQDKEFAKQVLRRAEKDYERIAADLGYARNSDFWTWSNRVGIYIYADHASYVKGSNQPEWSQGVADYTNRKIISYSESADFLDSILPHEMAHLIFRDFVGFKGEIPLWMDEGVAQWEEVINRQGIMASAREYLRKGTLLTLEDLISLDVRLISDTEKLHLCTTSLGGKMNFIIIDGKNLIELFYLESAALVGFLIERYGGNSFTDFCRQLRDGKNLEEALSFVYSVHLRSLEELQEEWVQYLEEGF